MPTKTAKVPVTGLHHDARIDQLERPAGDTEQDSLQDRVDGDHDRVRGAPDRDEQGEQHRGETGAEE